MQLEIIPQELTEIIGGEKTDFIAKVERDKPLAVSILIFVGSLFIILLSWGFLYQSHIMLTSSIDNNGINDNTLNIGLYINIGLFLIVTLMGFVMIYSEVKNLIRGGGFYAGTEKRLIHYSNGRSVVKYWKEFTGKVEIRGNMNKGSVILELKSGSRQKNRNKRVFVHHKQMIIGVINYYEIGEKCQKRINEKLRIDNNIIIKQ